ncbi:MAG: zinc-ribbon domain-containing protein [Bacilli bacterium]|jgi:DNA-directed RNA polymerase subunit RPC12/RpoP|nr:zinc-ribbon domain-containing protein [Bacilli bacterium]
MEYNPNPNKNEGQEKRKKVFKVLSIILMVLGFGLFFTPFIIAFSSALTGQDFMSPFIVLFSFGGFALLFVGSLLFSFSRGNGFRTANGSSMNFNKSNQNGIHLFGGNTTNQPSEPQEAHSTIFPEKAADTTSSIDSVSEGGVTCPICGAKNPAGMAFCTTCGAKLPKPLNASKPTKLCPDCGTINDGDAVFCKKCGKRL